MSQNNNTTDTSKATIKTEKPTRDFIDKVRETREIIVKDQKPVKK